MKYLFFVITGYISGSILYAYLIPKYLCGKDVILLSEDHNPGASNAFHCAGIGIGSIVIVCELLKGAIPVYIASTYLNPKENMFALIMLAPVLGHAYSLLLGGRGGKAIAVSFGVLLGIIPVWKPVLFLAGFYLLFSCIIVINPHSYRSIVTYIFFAISAFFFLEGGGICYGCLAIAVVVIVKHIKALRLDGVEIKEI